jgi:hypothetical protein
MKNILVFCLGLLFSGTASSQILQPVKWSYTAKKTSATTATVLIKATLDAGWHMYAQSSAGAVKTTFTFEPSKSFQLTGKVVEPKPLTKFEKAFDTNVSYFEKTVVFSQQIKLNGGKAVVKGTVECMVCSDQQCLPPATNEFSIPVN